jgi:hypothetical protein
LIKTLLESVWLFYLLGAALWGYLGLLAASSAGMPLAVGVLAGSFFWFGGVAVVYLVGIARHRAAARGWVGLGHRMGAEPFAASAGKAHLGYDAPPADKAVPLYQPAGRTWRIGPLVVGAACALGIAISVALPWGRGRVAWSSETQHVSGAVTPLSVAPIAVLLMLSAAFVILVVLLDNRLPRGTWLGLAAVLATFWCTLIVEWMTLDRTVEDTSKRVGDATGRVADASFSAACGAWVMLLSCVAVCGWLTWRTTELVRARHGRPPASPTAPLLLPGVAAPPAPEVNRPW